MSRAPGAGPAMVWSRAPLLVGITISSDQMCTLPKLNPQNKLGDHTVGVGTEANPTNVANMFLLRSNPRCTQLSYTSGLLTALSDIIYDRRLRHLHKKAASLTQSRFHAVDTCTQAHTNTYTRTCFTWFGSVLHTTLLYKWSAYNALR